MYLQKDSIWATKPTQVQQVVLQNIQCLLYMHAMQVHLQQHSAKLQQKDNGGIQKDLV